MPQITTLFLLCLAGINLGTNYEAMTIGGLLINLLVMEIKRAKTVFNKPLKIKEPSLIFTCSLTDFFHEALDLYRWEAWDIIRQCPQHTFQILAKRPERIAQHLPDFWNEIKGRVWLGTSIGSMKGITRKRRGLSIFPKVRAAVPPNCLAAL